MRHSSVYMYFFSIFEYDTFQKIEYFNWYFLQVVDHLVVLATLILYNNDTCQLRLREICFINNKFYSILKILMFRIGITYITFNSSNNTIEIESVY